MRNSILASALAVLTLAAGCSANRLDQSMQDGRVALLSGRPEDARAYFSRVAEINPTYKTTFAISEGVWTYVGWSYYDSGKYPEARAAFDQALTTDEHDSIARLYRGITQVRSNNRDQGVVEITTALRKLHQQMETLIRYQDGAYFDPNRQLRKNIEMSLAEKQAPIELVVSSQRIGKQLEEEINRARREESRAVFKY